MRNEKYQFTNLLQYKNIIYGISTRTFGSMKNEDGSLDCDNLEAYRKSLGIKEKAVLMNQIHGGTVAIVKDGKVEQVSETDGLVTNKKSIPLAVRTADCLPIMFYDPVKEVIGIAHAGYRGLLNHIIENTITHLVAHFNCNPKDILVGIGPSIETKCYEVGKEVIEKFEKTFPEFENRYVSKEGKFYLNLRGIAQQCLIKKGILKEQIEVMDVCTKCDPNFYSYRGGDKNGRFVSMISLV